MSYCSKQPLRLPLLLWRHFNWHLWMGFIIWLSLVLAFIFYKHTMAKHTILTSEFYTENTFQTEALANKAHEMVQDAIFLLIGGFLLAMVGGLLRKPIMTIISRNARTRSELIWKSLVLVELSVFMLALLPWPVGYTFGLEDIERQFLVLSVGSLPWLLTTGIASHRLAVALRLPPNHS
ncbi:MAG: hypothetical protein EOO56_14440 [Hymenobacter sp.]|nr:MAG: hypothetical protein EOO56_14440 [Hymenobacter sp.]